MKIMTVAGTRPELIRLSIIIKKLDKLVDHTLVYTNQNYDYTLSGVFFEELNIREPDYSFNSINGNTFGVFVASVFPAFERVLLKEQPDKILILGDTNSGLLALLAKKHGIPVYHMEAGNRCFDERVPEEANRRVIDTLSTYNLPYTENSKENLIREGYHKNFVFKIGNPINEVLNNHTQDIAASQILYDLGLKPQNFVLVTTHRTENVDDPVSLRGIVTAINKIAERSHVVFSLHPRTKDKFDQFGVRIASSVILSEPFGFFDFVKLEKEAKVVISDSGTVQEECCLFGVNTITIRRTTERQETIECGSNILSGTDSEKILEIFNMIEAREYDWFPPKDYMKPEVSDTVINILLGR